MGWIGKAARFLAMTCSRRSGSVEYLRNAGGTFDRQVWLGVAGGLFACGLIILQLAVCDERAGASAVASRSVDGYSMPLPSLSALSPLGGDYSAFAETMPPYEPTTNTYTVSLPVIYDRYKTATMPFGIQVYNLEPKTQNVVAGVGADWVRFGLSWQSIEPVNTTPEHYTWSPWFEQRLSQFQTAGIQVILTVYDNPAWAASYPSGPIDLVDVSEMAEFMQTVVARYSQPQYNVKYWELYNEPDNGDVLLAEEGWGYFGHTPQAYVDILAAIYQPIKSADPQSKLLLGGLAYDAWEPEGWFVQDFLDKVLEYGGAQYLDAINFHYYPVFAPNWIAYGPDILGKLNYLRQKLAYYGVDKPFVCTEAGWYSNEEAGGDERQSRYAAQVFVRAMSADLDPTIWFTLQDDTSYRLWGLVTTDMELKPSYYAYQTVVGQLRETRYLRTLSPSETGSQQIEAYEFRRVVDPLSVIPAWTNDESTRPLELHAASVLVVDKFGNEQWAFDGGDGKVDGHTHVAVGPSPVYLRFTPGGQMQSGSALSGPKGTSRW